MPHYVASHLGLHCLPKYLFRGFLVSKGLSWCLRKCHARIPKYSTSEYVCFTFPWTSERMDLLALGQVKMVDLNALGQVEMFDLIALEQVGMFDLYAL